MPIVKKPLSPKEKEWKKQRDNQKLLHNRILSAFSFKQITTWADYYRHVGLTPDPLKNGNTITFVELKAELEKQKQKLEERIQREIDTEQRTLQDKTNPLEQDKTLRVADTTDKQNSDSQDIVLLPPESPLPTKTVTDAGPTIVSTALSTVALEQEEEDTRKYDDDYGWTRSPNVSPDYRAYWFQKRASRQITVGFGITKHRLA